MKKNIKLLMIFGVLILAVLAGFFLLKQKPTPAKIFSGPKEKITLGVSKALVCVPVYIAQEKGFFAGEGLEAQIIDYDSGHLAVKDMLAQKVELATTTEFPLALRAFERDDWLIIVTFEYNYDDLKLLARRDKGIKTAADLKGKTVGITRGTTSELFLDFYLTHNKINGNEIKTVNLFVADLPLALKEGQVDAIAVWEPHAYKAGQLLGDKIIRLPAPEMYRSTFNLVAFKAFTRERPETVKKILRALDRAVTYINQNKKESQALLAAKLNSDPQMVAALWDDYTFELSLDRYLVLALEAEARWAIKNKLTAKKKVPNYLDYLYTEGLEAVKPGAVTIIR